MMEHERWDRVFSATCVGVPWQLRPDQRNLVRPDVRHEERSREINAKVPHDDRCRDRIDELMSSDDDQRQVERMTSRTTVDVENEIPCPETGEEVDVGEPSVQPRSVDEDQPRLETQSVPRPVEEQPIPTVRVGGSSGSGTRSGVGASETKHR